MDLIDRYVNAVARRLPRNKRADVREELRSNLADALDMHAGEEPTEQEIVTLLREFGRPEVVAASFAGDEQYLIGPSLYPTFKLVLQIVLAVLATILSLGFALALVLQPFSDTAVGPRMAELLSSMLDLMVTSVGISVVIFFVLQRLRVTPELKRRSDWDPRKLPRVREADLVGRGEAIAGIVFSALFLVIVNLYGPRLGLTIKPDGMLLLNRPIVDNLVWLNSAFLAGMLVNTWIVWSGRWSWKSRVAKISVDAFGVYVAYRVASAVATERPELLAAGLPEPVVSSIVGTAYSFPIFIGLIALFDAGRMLYRIWREPDGKSPIADAT